MNSYFTLPLREQLVLIVQIELLQCDVDRSEWNRWTLSLIMISGRNSSSSPTTDWTIYRRRKRARDRFTNKHNKSFRSIPDIFGSTKVFKLKLLHLCHVSIVVVVCCLMMIFSPGRGELLEDL